MSRSPQGKTGDKASRPVGSRKGVRAAAGRTRTPSPHSIPPGPVLSEAEQRQAEVAALLEASRAYRTLERLEDRQRAEHLATERRREEKELDEFAQEIRCRESGAGSRAAQRRDLSP